MNFMILHITSLAIAGVISTVSAACSSPAGIDNSVQHEFEADGKTLTAPAKVMPGIEVLREDGFKALQGKRVGLITNPTGIDNSLRATIDILAAAPCVKLTALFAPEHGVRGNYTAGASVANEVDAATGVPVYSLHGRTRKPTAEMLRDVDVLVYDIQDIGCRSYTFISTMGLAMEAASQSGKEFMVLDRPNPLGGLRVEGPLVNADCRSFVSQYPIPYVYGLTPGELAEYLNDSGLIGAKKVALTVVPMKGWHRDMTFEMTGMPWVPTSPHIPTTDAALLYPATGIMGELDYVSIGVGYTLPFSLAGAPWVDASKLSSALTALQLPGIEFRPLYYRPYYAKFKEQTVGGVQIYVTDSATAQLSTLQFYIMQELVRLYPSHKPFASATAAQLDMFDKVCGSKLVRQRFAQAYRVDDILPLWTEQADKFRSASAKYHIYK